MELYCQAVSFSNCNRWRGLRLDRFPGWSGLDPRLGLVTWNSLQYPMEAAERIEEGLPIPANLEVIFQDGTGLGGARPKASVRNEEQVLWLAKFSSRTDASNFPMAEYCALRLAAEAGLTVPPLQYLIATVSAKVREWRVYFESYGASSEQIDRVAPAFRHIDHVPTPELRRSLP
jgi:hypothetical protein